jgi:hypothetical protein
MELSMIDMMQALAELWYPDMWGATCESVVWYGLTRAATAKERRALDAKERKALSRYSVEYIKRRKAADPEFKKARSQAYAEWQAAKKSDPEYMAKRRAANRACKLRAKLANTSGSARSKA